MRSTGYIHLTAEEVLTQPMPDGLYCVFSEGESVPHPMNVVYAVKRGACLDMVHTDIEDLTTLTLRNVKERFVELTFAPMPLRVG